MRYVAVALVLALAFTSTPYVRRRVLPRVAAVQTEINGSRDRRLHGKARVKARRAVAS